MGNHGNPNHWDINQPPSPALKRLAAASSADIKASFRGFLRDLGYTEAQIDRRWSENMRYLAGLKEYLTSQGIEADFALDGEAL